jgi:hypothetical protein
MSAWPMRTPVALIVFNRPELTERVFAAIAAAKPPVLLVVADGPRAGRDDEAERVARVRAIVTKVDWDCDVRTNFAESNLGCRRRLSSGLDWVFEQVPECIVLEDDCLPDASFFRFCEEMLERFRDDRRVFQVNGTNYRPHAPPSADSYYFSAQSHVWGWASWADRWRNHYDVAVRAWPRIRDEGSLADVVGGPREAHYWRPILERLHRGEIDTWDYQWAFACMLNGALIVTPTVNLISNIGFGGDATHTSAEDHPLADLPRAAVRFPLRHPVGMFRRASFDREYFDRHSSPTVGRRIANRLRRLAARLAVWRAWRAR